jgi:hypothetical protein
MSALYDDSSWPIVVVTTPKYVMLPDEHALYLDRLSGYHRRGQLFGFVFDVRQSPAPTAEQRRQLAERIDRDAAQFGHRAPVALVVSSSVQSGVVKVIQWMLREPHPVEVFTSVEAAKAWLSASFALKPVHTASTPGARDPE